MSGKLNVMLLEILSVLYLIAFTQLDGWVRWIALAMFVENLFEGVYMVIKSRIKS